MDRVDRLAAAYREALGPSPDIVSAAVTAFRGGVTATVAQRAGRVLLGVAGAVGVVLAAALAVVESSHGRLELAGLHAAVAAGFVLAAARPLRYGRALVPVTAIAVAAVLLPSAADHSAVTADLLGEAAHLPLLAGALGLFLLLNPAPGQRP